MRSFIIFVVLLTVAAPARAGVRVVATTSDLASIVKAVGRDRVQVDFIVDGRRDPHYVEVLPSYMLKLRKADLLFMVGLQLESWAPGIIDGARNRNLRVVECHHGVPVLDVPRGSVDASMGDIHAAGNPHYWLNPENGFAIARTVHETLVEEDPEGAAAYDAGLRGFETVLADKVREWKRRMEPFRGAEVVTFHDTWPYFNDAFGLVPAGFVEPKPGVNPSAGHTASIIRLIRDRGIRVIGVAPFYDDRVCRSIARQTGAEVVTLATSVGGIDGAEDYFGLFDANIDRLVGVLAGKP